jgi:hypothetical protein
MTNRPYYVSECQNKLCEEGFVLKFEKIDVCPKCGGYMKVDKRGASATKKKARPERSRKPSRK